MHTYMNDKNLHSLTEEDLLFLVKSFADKHKSHDTIIDFARTDQNILLQMIDDHKVFSALINPQHRVLSISTFFFFFQMIRHSFRTYSEQEDFIKKVNLHQASYWGIELSEAEISEILNDIDFQLYMANMLTFFSTSARMNDPQKTQNGWLYITDLIRRIEEASPTNEFLLQAFIGNYTLCLTGFYKNHVEEKFRYGKRLVNCHYYSEFGQKFFLSASRTKIAESTGLSQILASLAVGFHIIRLALDDLKHKDHFYGCSVA